MKYILLIIGLCFLPLNAYAGGNHHPEPVPLNVPDDGSNHNALAIGIVVIAATACIVTKCWKPKPVKTAGSSIPEIPQNEYITIRQKR